MRNCGRCGSEIADDNTFQFCGQCGAPLARIMQPYPINANYRDGSLAPVKRARSKKQTGGIIAIISLGLAFILLFNLVIGPAVSGKTISDRFRDKNRLTMDDSIDVSADQTIVEIGDVMIDVNPLNLYDGSEKLTVKKYSPTVGEDGFLGEEYDISLGDQHYLLAPMTISLPYDPDTANDSQTGLF